MNLSSDDFPMPGLKVPETRWQASPSIERLGSNWKSVPFSASQDEPKTKTVYASATSAAASSFSASSDARPL